MMTAKKTLLAATAAVTALVATPAMAADLGRPVLKAPPPPPAPVYTWTGCYLGGGGGYGMWNQDNFTVEEINGLTTTSQTTTAGGRGGFGTVQVGCDYQLSGDWVIGAFADWDFGSLTGKPELSNELWFGTEKQNHGPQAPGWVISFCRNSWPTCRPATLKRISKGSSFSLRMMEILSTGTSLPTNGMDGSSAQAMSMH